MTDIRDLYKTPYYSTEQLEFIFSQIFSKKLEAKELNKEQEFELPSIKEKVLKPYFRQNERW